MTLRALLLALGLLLALPLLGGAHTPASLRTFHTSVTLYGAANDPTSLQQPDLLAVQEVVEESTRGISAPETALASLARGLSAGFPGLVQTLDGITIYKAMYIEGKWKIVCCREESFLVQLDATVQVQFITEVILGS